MGHLGVSEGTVGEWRKFTEDDIRKSLYKIAGDVNIKKFEKESGKAISFFEDKKINVLSILSTYLSKDNDNFVLSIQKQIEELNILTQVDFINYMRPKRQIMSRDAPRALFELKLLIERSHIPHRVPK